MAYQTLHAPSLARGPQEVVDAGKLSAAQLEALLYACMRFDARLEAQEEGGSNMICSKERQGIGPYDLTPSGCMPHR